MFSSVLTMFRPDGGRYYYGYAWGGFATEHVISVQIKPQTCPGGVLADPPIAGFGCFR